MSLKSALAGAFAPGGRRETDRPATARAEANGDARARARKGVPAATVASMYRPARSFVDHLP